MNRKSKYFGDSRYEKVFEQMKLLGIQDVSTKRQEKNGTTVWRLPIKNNYYRSKPNYIEVASFSTGYVRNQNSCSSNYQINKQYKQNVRWTMLDGSKLITHKSVMIAREKIYSGMARLNYMLEFYKRNY